LYLTDALIVTARRARSRGSPAPSMDWEDPTSAWLSWVYDPDHGRKYRDRTSV